MRAFDLHPLALASQLIAADADHDAREHLQNMREERARALEPATFTPAEEARADDALLILFKLREQLLARDADTLAGQVDDVLRDLVFVARKGVR